MSVLGNKIRRWADVRLDVIGDIELSASGNTVIRVGQMFGDSWSQACHVVLTPDEREELIAALVAQRPPE